MPLYRYRRRFRQPRRPAAIARALRGRALDYAHARVSRRRRYLRRYGDEAMIADVSAFRIQLPVEVLPPGH